MSDPSENLGFAEVHDVPIPYIHRISSYYQTLGYGKPYEWARYADVPFALLEKPLSEGRVALVTTAAPYQPDKGDQGPGAPYNAAAKFYRVYTDSIDGEPDLRVSHIGIDREHTTAEDINTWFPLKQLKRLCDEGQIAELTPRFYGAPTNRSQRTTIDQDCVELLDELRNDQADVAIIVAS